MFPIESGYKMDDSFAETPLLKPYMTCTIGDRLRYHAETTPDKNAFIIHSKTDESRDIITCREIYDQSLSFARGLLNFGVRNGDKVGISSKNNRNWLISTFASQIIGTIPFYFSPSLSDGKDVFKTMEFLGNCTTLIIDSEKIDVNMEFIQKLVDSSVKENEKFIVKNDNCPELKYLICDISDEQQWKCNVFSDILEQGFKVNNISIPDVHPDDFAVILTTSGTTGVPKYISKSHVQLLHYGEGSAIAYKMTPNDIFFNDRMFEWLGGCPVLYLISGCTHVTVIELFGLDTFSNIAKFMLKIISQEKCTVSKFLPLFIFEILKLEDEVKHRQRLIAVSAVPVHDRCAEVIGRYTDSFVCHYGSSEMNFAAYKYVSNAANFSNYCTGIPLPGVEMKVVDEEGKTVKRNTEGELMIRNTRAFSGYFKNPVETKNSLLENGWFKTDDCAYINDDGDFIVKGRCSDIILCYGAPLLPSPIEAAVKPHPSVADVCVVRISDPTSFQTPCVCILLKENSNTDVREIEEFSTKDLVGPDKSLALHRRYMIFTAFPRTKTGKINKKKLLEMAESRLRQQLQCTA